MARFAQVITEDGRAWNVVVGEGDNEVVCGFVGGQLHPSSPYHQGIWISATGATEAEAKQRMKAFLDDATRRV